LYVIHTKTGSGSYSVVFTFVKRMLIIPSAIM